MKVSKTVSIELELLQRVLEVNPNFSKAVNEALESWIYFKKETVHGNTIHFSKIFNIQVPANIIWQLVTFEGLVKWVNMLTRVEYLTEQTKGIGTRCKLYGRLRERESSSIAEITEYVENEKMVFVLKAISEYSQVQVLIKKVQELK